MSPDDGNKPEDRAFFSLTVTAGVKDTEASFHFSLNTTREIAEDILNTPQTELAKGFEKFMNILQGRE